MDTINVELTKQDINNLLVMINLAPIKGEHAGVVVNLKNKLLVALPTESEVTSTEDKKYEE